LFLNIYLIIIKNIKSKSQHYNEKLPEYSNTRIIINKDKSPEKELTDDLIEIIMVFS